MTEKEKAEAYDEAIERAKKLYGNGITEELFPELKGDDDDDRIKKDLIQWVNEFPDIIWRGHYKKDIIDWFEKQDKKSSWKPSKEEMDALYSLSYITNEYDEHKEDVITHLYQDLKREFFNDSSYENMFSLDNKEDDVRRRSTIQVLEYARSLDAYNQYGKADIDKNISWLEKQGEQEKQVHFPKFTFDDILALQDCMVTAKNVQEDNELYEQLNLIHNKMYDAYRLGKQGETSTDKVEPKFKVGDWVVNKFGDSWYIDSLDKKTIKYLMEKETIIIFLYQNKTKCISGPFKM